MKEVAELYTENHTNGHTINYKIINGICYHLETPNEVCEVLERARLDRTRIRVYYGNREPYKNWNEEHDIYGYVGKSTGNHPIPLLIFNSRSYGGGALLDDCILKIVNSKTQEVLYQYENYVHPLIELITNPENEIHPYQIKVEGSEHSNHKTLDDAVRILRKLV